MVYGTMMKAPLNGTDTDGSYHCWIEFFAPHFGWIPLDVSLANMFAEEIPLNDQNRKLVDLTTPDGYRGPDKNLVDFYFGNLDDRRVVWSKGRDLIMQPPQDGGPVNALIKAYVEVDGKPSTDWTRVLTYKQIANGGCDTDGK
jgi:hypothetical protein